jgi:hypothetical protein
VDGTLGHVLTCQGRDDYYASEGEEGGDWLRSGARILGAAGAVDEQGLSALLRTSHR